jgi:hypothetical protein
MAKQRPQNTGTVGTTAFEKDLVEDVNGFRMPPNSWTQARNAVPNTVVGDIGELSNDASNYLCDAAPYTIHGIIHLEEDKWAIFSTDNTDSEIGLFVEDLCQYTTVVNDRCLGFNTHNLIKGVSKENFDCTWQVYWEDGNQPSRTMNMDNVPWIQDCQVINDCNICTDTEDLDCDAIRLAPLVTNPCFRVERGASGGELVNGSYYVVAAYTINQQKVTDYSVPSNVQAIFNHSGIAGSIDIVIEEMDENFDEFELIVVITRNQQTVARNVGIYSTRQTRITLDTIDDRWVSVGIDLLPLRNPIADKSDAMFRNGDYMLRVGPTDKFDFNYQPLANQIGTKWVAVQYPMTYYRNGGNNTGYMRDEVYSLFIRWVYDTGDKTASFHIPGRVAEPTDLTVSSGPDAQPDIDDGLTPFNWRVNNTASVTSTTSSTLPDGGVVIAEGDMGYWESSEIYDDDKPAIWNASSDPIWGSSAPAHDLCGKPIRHHRFPDNNAQGSTSNQETNHYSNGGQNIRIMGLRLDNIKPPLDNDGNVIPNIVGYEILRGTREGNKSILAKGMINNMRSYAIQGGITTRTGLYPNYPYNDLRIDPYLSTVEVDDVGDYQGQTAYSKRNFTFHSPDTSFKDPYLSAKELRIYGEFNGNSEGQFLRPEKHPRHTLVTDLAFIAAAMIGVGYAMLQMKGEKTTRYSGPKSFNQGTYPYGVNIFAGTGSNGVHSTPWDFGVLQSTVLDAGFNAGGVNGITAANIWSGAYAAQGLIGTPEVAFYNSMNGTAITATAATPGYIGASYSWDIAGGTNDSLPWWLNALNAIPTLSAYWSEGVDNTLRLIKAFSKDRQFALQYQSHCFYDNFRPPQANNNRRSIGDAIYLDSQIQDFGTSFRINNVFRSKTVALDTTADVYNPQTTDTSRRALIDAPGALPDYDDPEVPFTTPASSHYTGMKQRLRNQYGQIEAIIEVPVTTCMIDRSETTTDVLFGGDIYIGRHTEKNTFFFFYDWQFDQPDGFEFNYKLRQMLPYTRWWMDTDPIDAGEVMSSIVSSPFSIGAWVLPNDKHVLDGPTAGVFTVKKRFMYLFNSGVRDFFVESEVNVDLRDWGDNDTERHYDYERYTDTKQIFDMSIIKSTNFWKYDYSLSISRLFNNFISWGNTHKRNYNPQVAEDCFVYRPNRVTYSLPQHLENEKDNWKIFLPNNYRDFKSRVTAVKPVNKNGALFMFENESPVQFLGVDQLQTDAGTKITVGDGGLFNMPIQNVLNTDDPYEYGSCQDRLSVINTASGIFWMSQNQGKIFHMQQGVKEISAMDMKWWFAEFLPYRLTKQFPDFELTDNPVAGIGCQTIYDNTDQIVFFCKKDYEVRRDITDEVTYTGHGDDFLVNGRLPIKLGDPDYFEDASWTVSYDPKTEGWIGYHDWHPNLAMPSKNTFLTILNDGIWKHNDRCDSYCNFYGIDYPFEVEYAIVTPQQVNTLRSVEYYMEVFKYDENCYDRFHVLDFNFDEAIIYNSEQCSGLLRLNLSPKNNAPEIITYPQINPTNIGILFSKVEQKYRFNQFWDITADRGEFNPAAERVIFNTESNGYIRNLNPNNLNYNKFALERKKFRHFKNTVLLRRRVCGDRNMVVAISNNKNLNSPR